MNYSKIISITSNDTGENQAGGAIHSVAYTATGGETSITLAGGIECTENGQSAYPDLRGKMILLLSKDGRVFREVESNPTGTQFSFNATTGQISFAADIYPLEQGEDVFIQYGPAASTSYQTAEPVSLSAMKSYLKLNDDVSEDDELINALISAARQECETYTDLSFVTKTITAVLDVSGGQIKLPGSPFRSLVSLAYTDGIDISNYTITGTMPAYLELYTAAPVKIVYNAGYTVLPAVLQNAIKQRVADLYFNRGDAALSNKVKAILKPFRLVA